jgi:ubiquinone/menaquinone biosynthesis C-methylase UbiE
VPSPLHDERPIFDLFASHFQTRVVETAVRLGIFDALCTPLSVASLRQRIAIGEQATEAIVSVLAASGLITNESGQLALTPIAREYLTSDSPFFKGDMFNLISDDELRLMREVHFQDGRARPATSQWLAGTVHKPDQQAKHMHAHTYAAASAMGRHAAFGEVRNLLDVAGGAGTVSIAIAQQNPTLRCTVMDLPGMAEASSRLIAKHGVADRVTFVGKNMFEDTWPTGFDAVMFSNIFHDWTRPRCVALAHAAYSSLPAGGRVFVNEMLLNENKTGPLGPALFSMMMLLRMEGKQFTQRELTSLLEEAGFSSVETIAQFGYYSLITGRRS